MENEFIQSINTALYQQGEVYLENRAQFSSRFAVSDLAAASIASVGIAAVNLIEDLGLSATKQNITVDQRLASLWFVQSIEPVDWKMPPVWDEIAGDYQTADGWIKLHTNLAPHKAAVLSVLSVEASRDKVAREVRRWSADDLESAIVAQGGVAAAMRSRQVWQQHAQGMAVAKEPLIAWQRSPTSHLPTWSATIERPLNGLRVLDLTRVLAGPVATRTLAGLGADVLRIDPPGWDEQNVVPDISLGKRCSYLDLSKSSDRDQFEALLAEAHVLVHGYRPGALEGLGYGQEARRQISPACVEVSLDAYGWSGPWSERRGFDSLVQMSCGIAHAGMKWAKAEQPTPLPVQALDHATGYLMAASTLRALSFAVSAHELCSAQLSLARTAELLAGSNHQTDGGLSKETHKDDYLAAIELTPWGKTRRLKSALQIAGTALKWSSPAVELGSTEPSWLR